MALELVWGVLERLCEVGDAREGCFEVPRAVWWGRGSEGAESGLDVFLLGAELGDALSDEFGLDSFLERVEL